MMLQLDLLPASAQRDGCVLSLSVMGHGEFRRLLRQIERATLVVAVAAPGSNSLRLFRVVGPRPVPPARTVRRHLTAAATSPTAWRCFKDSTGLHLASFCLEDADPDLAGSDVPAFAVLEVK